MGESVDTVSHFDIISVTIMVSVMMLYWHCSNQLLANFEVPCCIIQNFIDVFLH